MLRQYSPQRHRYEIIRNRHHAVGTIPIGTVFRCAHFDDPQRRERSLIVEAWHTREIEAGAKVNGKWESRFFARFGHLATVRDLANGRRFKLADHFIKFCVDHD